MTIAYSRILKVVINFGLTYHVPCSRISCHHVIDFEQRMYKITGSSSYRQVRTQGVWTITWRCLRGRWNDKKITYDNIIMSYCINTHLTQAFMVNFQFKIVNLNNTIYHRPLYTARNKTWSILYHLIGRFYQQKHRSSQTE